MYRIEIDLMVANAKGSELRREARDARRSRRPGPRPTLHENRTTTTRPLTLRRPGR
jgi:hypothetical protein